ncbi:hypothetical protein D3C72_369420 [compost metagenome]
MKLPMNLSIAAIAAVLLIGCATNDQESSNPVVNTDSITHKTLKAARSFKKGDRVPNDEVCMVNNTYMGKKQLKVIVNGLAYYGCCKACEERIPTDESVRKAVDPHTTKLVDKAKAYIVLLNEGGDVAYFENEQNYVQFLKQNELKI